MFGKSQPNLQDFKTTVCNFLKLGIDKVTISGGDPLTIKGLQQFIDDLRSLGVNEIKLDTIGTTLLKNTHDSVLLEFDYAKATALLNSIDYLGLPLDGWSAESVNYFRKGRAGLFSETKLLLSSINNLKPTTGIIINTVANKKNINNLHLIFEELLDYSIIHAWHIFQYTSTDLVSEQVNDMYAVTDQSFSEAELLLSNHIQFSKASFTTNFYSNSNRLGWYLLINSDGNAWLPDENGKTINLGKVFEREEEILEMSTAAIKKFESNSVNRSSALHIM